MYSTCIQLCDLEVIYGSCVSSSSIMASMYDLNVLYSRKLLREKTFADFEVCDYSQKFSLQKFGGVVSIGSTRNN